MNCNCTKKFPFSNLIFHFGSCHCSLPTPQEYLTEGCPSLKVLSISNNKAISETSFKLLVKCKGLLTLQIQYLNFSTEARNALADGIPNLDIVPRVLIPSANPGPAKSPSSSNLLSQSSSSNEP